jgi:signal peptidase I
MVFWVKIATDCEHSFSFLDKPSEVYKRLFSGVLYILLILYSGAFLSEINPLKGLHFLEISIVWALLYLVKISVEFFFYKKYLPKDIVINNKGKLCVHTKNGEITFSNTLGKYYWWGGLLFEDKKNKVCLPVRYLRDKKQRKELFGVLKPLSYGAYRLYYQVMDFLYSVFVALVLAMHIRVYIAENYYIPTGSMEDTLLIGDHILALKFIYGHKILVLDKILPKEYRKYAWFPGIREPKRGDVIIFTPPHERDKDFIKRCIGLPGERYSFPNDGYVYINGKRLDEPYVKGKTFFIFHEGEQIAPEGKIPAGKYLVLGDNRENSSDSRDWGFVDREDIKGKAFLIFFTGEFVHIGADGITFLKHAYVRDEFGLPIRKVSFFERFGFGRFEYNYMYKQHSFLRKRGGFLWGKR